MRSIVRKSLVQSALLVGAAAAAAVSLTEFGCSSQGGGVPGTLLPGAPAPTENVLAPADRSGTVGLELTLPGGQQVATVTWAITGPNGASTPVKNGSIKVQNSQSIAFLVGGIPAGTGYSITLSATTTDGNTTCVGSATFAVTARATTNVSVLLQCMATGSEAGAAFVTATTVNCATLNSVSALPASALVGSAVAVSASAVAPDPSGITYAWSATSGSFDTPNAANANFTCAAAGTATLTVTVGDGADSGSCGGSSATTTVTCTGHVDAAQAFQTTTKIKHLVVIFGENISFDHYFATYPNAQNNAGDTAFSAAPGTPVPNNLIGPLDPSNAFAPVSGVNLLTANPTASAAGNGTNAINPFRLSAEFAETSSQNHNYTPEQQADDNGKMDLYPEFTGSAGPPPPADAGAPPQADTKGLVMAYFDGNTLSTYWSYAQRYAINDNMWTTNFGPSTPGAINVISGQTNGVVGSAAHPASAFSTSHVTPDGNGGFALIGDIDPLGDACSSAADQGTLSGKNIGDLLNGQNVTWGWFEGGFNLTVTNANNTTACHRSTPQTVPFSTTSTDYVPHHQPFQYYASTANLAHTPVSSIAAVGHSVETDGMTPEPANHQYDTVDFFDALAAGNLPAVVYLKAPSFQDGHPGNSNPIDEQNFIASIVDAAASQPGVELERGRRHLRRLGRLVRPPGAADRERVDGRGRRPERHGSLQQRSAAERHGRSGDDDAQRRARRRRRGSRAGARSLRIRHARAAHGHLALRQDELRRPHARRPELRRALHRGQLARRRANPAGRLVRFDRGLDPEHANRDLSRARGGGGLVARPPRMIDRRHFLYSTAFGLLASCKRRPSSSSTPGLCVGSSVPATARRAYPSPLHPGALARFVDPLPIPPVLQANGTRPDPSAPGQSIPYYRVAMREAAVAVHRDVPPTRVWSYAGSFPGPTFETRSGQGLLVEWVNELPQRHFLPIDHSLCGAGADRPEVRTVVHVHGARVPSESDGYPEDWYTPGRSAISHYPNRQDAATLWYHDHAMGIERLNQYAGLFGLFLIRDDVEDALELPSGPYEVPLMLCDRLLDATGQLIYPTSDDPEAPWIPELDGDSLLVNGKLYPYLEVQPRPYRLRIVNASNTRVYYLSLSHGLAMDQIGSDQGLLAAPAALPTVTLAPAERADVVIDFGQAAGQEIVLQNQTFQLMQFRVAPRRTAARDKPVPRALRAVARTPAAEAIKTRFLTLNEYEIPKTRAMLMLLNGARWHDPVTERPAFGSVEIWELVNLTEDTHPIHLHMVRFQVLERQPFDADTFMSHAVMKLTGEPALPAAQDAGWKDTVRCDPGFITRIIVRFDGYKGRYVWHCHLLEHAANEMMRPFEVVG